MIFGGSGHTITLSLMSFCLIWLYVICWQGRDFYIIILMNKTVSTKYYYLQVMYIQAMVIAYMIFQIIRKLFFGELRVTETEVIFLAEILFIIGFHVSFIY